MGSTCVVDRGGGGIGDDDGWEVGVVAVKEEGWGVVCRCAGCRVWEGEGKGEGGEGGECCLCRGVRGCCG